jgi:PAS domain-containing protein
MGRPRVPNAGTLLPSPPEQTQRMSYVTVLWSTAAAAALLLAVMHALVWIYDRRARAHLAFAFSALGLAGGTITELGMMYAQTPQEWGEWVWWTHLPLFVIVVAMSIFMHLYLSAGRRWLLAALIAARAIVLLINLGSDPNINFESIHAIERIPFLGEEVSVATSVVTGKYQWFALLASLLFPAFIIDVIVTLWRRGTADARRVAVLVGGPVLISVAISLAMTQLVIWEVRQMPILLIPPFLIALGAMMLEVSRNMLRASRLAHELHESEQRLQQAAKAAGAGLWSWDATSGRMWMTEQARAILGLPRT